MKKKPLMPAESQSERFSNFVKELIERFNPLYIVKFGEISTTKNVQNAFISEQCISDYQYYLLIVIEGTTRIEHGVQDFANSQFAHGKITVFVHGKDAVNEAIEKKNYFFINALNLGQQIYSSDGWFFTHENYELDTLKTLESARKHHFHRISMASGFLDGASECFSNENFNVCVFMLHQAVEQSCIAMIRVFMSYRSDIHNLRKLLDICACFSEKPRELLLGTPENRRLVEILMGSYSQARYKDNFSVEMGDADKLFSLVHNFLILAKELCNKKIEQLVQIFSPEEQNADPILTGDSR